MTVASATRSLSDDGWKKGSSNPIMKAGSDALKRIWRSRRVLFAVALFAVLVTGVSGCSEEEEFPVPTEDQVVGSWSNPGGGWIKFK